MRNGLSNGVRSPWLVAVLLGVALASGCAQLNVARPTWWPWEGNDKTEAPGRVVAFWTDTMLYPSGEKPVRGFGGRLMFYSAKSDKPIRVAGQLIVYAFDEEGDPNHVRPDRKFVFTPEQFAKYYSKSDLGHSYSVWLPWDEAGGPQKEISLIVRFVPVEGSVVVSEQARHLLPGLPGVNPTPLSPAAATGDSAQASRREAEGGAPAGQTGFQAAGQTGVRQASYETPAEAGGADPNGASPSRLETTTITIPARLARAGVAQTQATPAATTVAPTVPAAPSANPPSTAGPTATAATAPVENPPPQGLTPQPARFGPSRSRALGGPIASPDRDRGPWPPRRAEWPSHSESSPTAETSP